MYSARARAMTYFVFEFNVLVQMLSSRALAFVHVRQSLGPSGRTMICNITFTPATTITKHTHERGGYMTHRDFLL